MPEDIPRNSDQLSEYYSRRLAKKAEELAGVKRKINRVAILRLAVVILTALTGFLIYDTSFSAFIIVLVAGVSVFLFLVNWHFKLFASRAFLTELTLINREELERLEGSFPGKDTGEEFVDKSHPYTSDLDIFGNGSLFQYISRCSSIPGKKCLAEWLQKAAEEAKISSRQQAISGLQKETEWRQNFEATGRLGSEEPGDAQALLNWVNEPSLWTNKKAWQVLLWALPAITITALVFYAFSLVPGSLPLLLVFIQAGIVIFNLRNINFHYYQTSRNYKMLQKYAALIRKFESAPFGSSALNDLKSRLKTTGRSAGDCIAALGRNITALDNRNNFMMVGFLNGLFMWDLRFAISLEKWKEKYKLQMEGWFKVLGEADALSSLGTFYFNNAGFVIPVLSKNEMLLQGNDLAHPLLRETERIANDITIEKSGKILLVTGSNMAGKSTFLRAVGVNFVLATTGAPVCASSFTFHPMPLYSSMRVGDSIQSRESTFYAELKRLKQIIEASQQGPILILLDEILKGTNSKDKLTGSIALIRQLLRNNASGIIATHDLALGEMEKEFPGNIKNYSFEVNIENEQFTFDYKLKVGVCKTMNATQLMKKMGISIN